MSLFSKEKKPSSAYNKNASLEKQQKMIIIVFLAMVGLLAVYVLLCLITGTPLT